MKRFLSVCLVFMVMCGVAFASDMEVGANLQRVAVNLRCENVQGSGTIILASLGDGTTTTWVLTAGHVVDGLRQVETVVKPNGSERKMVSYRDAQLIQEIVQEGRVIGERMFDAKVMSIDSRRDVALLRVRADNQFQYGASFYLDSEIPAPGMALFHCGAPGGKDVGGTCSLTSGIVSRLGVRIPHFGGAEKGVFDQVTCPAMGGSSGGLVAMREDGRIVGIITLGLRGADSFHWMVPVRSLLKFTERAGGLWILDPSADSPETEDDINLKLEVNSCN